MKGITFGNYHSYDDFHLVLGSQEIGSPDIKENKIKIEGADGDLDFTDFFGSPKYENVRHKFNFSTIVPQAEFLSLFSTVKNAIHGKKLRVILDDDPLFYYIGRCFVSKFTNEKGIGIVSVECDCEPYKYKIEKTRHIASLSGKNVFDYASNNVSFTGGTTSTVIQNGLRLTLTEAKAYRLIIYPIMPSKMSCGVPITVSYKAEVHGNNNACVAAGYFENNKPVRIVNSSTKTTGEFTVIADSEECFGDLSLILYANHSSNGVSVGDYIDYTDIQVEIGDSATAYEPFDNKEKTISIFLENLKTPAVPTIISQHEVTITNGEETLVAREEEPLVSPEFQLSEGINQFNITGIGLVAFEWQEGGL